MRINYFRFEITPSIMNPNTRSLRFDIERQGLPSLHLTQEVPIDDAESLLHLCFRRAENALKKEINRLKEIQNEPVRTRRTEDNGLSQRNDDPT